MGVVRVMNLQKTSEGSCVSSFSGLLPAEVEIQVKEGGTGLQKTIREPTRRQSTCEKDHARAEMAEREQSKRDRATKRRRRKKVTLHQKRVRQRRKGSDRYSHDTSLTF